MLFILTDFTIFFLAFKLVHAITPDITDRNTRLFSILMRHFGNFQTAFLIQLRNWYAKDLPLPDGIEAKT